MTVSTFEEITKKKPEKSLTQGMHRKAGRNNYGRITVRHRGGGTKRLYRIIDFKRQKLGVPATVEAIEYDPFRTARIALLQYQDGEKSYILAPLGLKVGDTVTVEAFEDGQQITVAGVSKGKGFQGTVRRHNFGRGPETHGSHNIRQPGSIGASAYPSRVFKGMRMAGHMGSQRVTQRGLKIVRRDVENNLLLIKGSVPGAKNSVVVIKGR
jgi:hypothetical protein